MSIVKKPDERKWLYKDGQSQMFETKEAVADARKKGWKDSPEKNEDGSAKVNGETTGAAPITAEAYQELVDANAALKADGKKLSDDLKKAQAEVKDLKAQLEKKLNK